MELESPLRRNFLACRFLWIKDDMTEPTTLDAMTARIPALRVYQLEDEFRQKCGNVAEFIATRRILGANRKSEMWGGIAKATGRKMEELMLGKIGEMAERLAGEYEESGAKRDPEMVSNLDKAVRDIGEFSVDVFQGGWNEAKKRDYIRDLKERPPEVVKTVCLFQGVGSVVGVLESAGPREGLSAWTELVKLAGLDKRELAGEVCSVVRDVFNGLSTREREILDGYAGVSGEKYGNFDTMEVIAGKETVA